MKFTVVLIGLFCISSSWAAEKQKEEPKDKREAPVGYPSSGHSTQTLQIQPSHDDSNTISIGAGYSVGGAKGLSFGGLPQQSGLHYDGLQSSGGHATIQLPPITLQPNQGGYGGDISELMSQLSHGLSTGALQLQPVGGSHYSGASFGQEGSQAQYSFGAPKLQQYSVSEQQSSVPIYAVGTKGLGSYGGASTGPVLFNPADNSHSAQLTQYAQSSQYAQPAQYAQSAQYIQPAQYAHSFGGASAGAGHSFGDAALSLGNSGHSFGGASYKSFGGNFGGLGKTSFKPSAFIGASLQSEGPHAISGLSTHAIPSFGHSYAPVSSGGHASFAGNLGSFGGGSSKFNAPSYLPPKSYGSALDAIAAFSGSSSHASSPPGTTYGFPSASHGIASASSHGASSSPQFYLSSSKHGAPSFGEGSSFKAPISGHGSLSSFSSGPKYSFGGHGSGASLSSSRYASPKDSHGAYSESTYNTIKYSEEMKPRVH